MNAATFASLLVVLKIGTMAATCGATCGGSTSPSSSLWAMIIAPISRVLTPQRRRPARAACF